MNREQKSDTLELTKHLHPASCLSKRKTPVAGSKARVGWPRLSRLWEAEPGLSWAEGRKELPSACRSLLVTQQVPCI